MYLLFQSLLLCALSAPDDARTEVRREQDGAQQELDRATPGFATAIDLDAQQGAQATDGMAEVLARTPGVTVRSVGGLGQFSAVSMRGSSAQQVAVFVDGVPVGDSVGGLVNVADLPLDALRAVHIYRGYVPIAFGAAAIGGAINLVSTRAGDEPRASLWAGRGSFGSGQLGAMASVPLGSRGDFTSHVGYARSRGDFQFFDDAGTPRTRSDDRTTTRTNNGYDRLQARVAGGVRMGPWELRGQQWALWKDQGIAGAAAVQSQRAALVSNSQRTMVSAVRHRLGRPGGRAQFVASFARSLRHFEDPLDEVGVFRDDETTRNLQFFGAGRLRIPAWRGAFLGVVLDQRSEGARVNEASVSVGQVSGDATRRRFAYGLGLELEQFLAQTRVRLVPAIRLDLLDSRFQVAPGEGEVADEGRDRVTFAASPRLGGRVRLGGGVELRGSAGRYFRAPTLLEMFGDRGFVVGNEGLKSERGTAVDLGAVAERALGDGGRIYGQVAGFGTWSEDLIQWVQAGAVSRPVNVAGARVYGLETSFELELWNGWFDLSSNYTWARTENQSEDPSQRGQRLPGRPEHDAFARLSSGHEWGGPGREHEPRLFYTYEFIAGTFLDPSGRRQIPARSLHGVGAEMHLVRRLHLAIEVRNLLDTRVTTWRPPVAGVDELRVPLSDFIGYPLPGRSVWATLRIDLNPAPRKQRNS